MIVGRSEPLDYKEVFEAIVNVTSDYVTSCGLKSMVIGLSGGLDSTVCAAICSEVSKKTGAVLIGISLPCSTNKDDEKNSARLAGSEFCSKYDESNIQDVFTVLERTCHGISKIPSTPISQGNIKARLRMIMLYDIAAQNKGIVIDTDNLTEHYLGFFTVNGDVADFNPIGNLWKTEVYGLAKYMFENIFKGSEALKAAIEITPTDGNGVSNSDLDQIMPGYTYSDVDNILMCWVPLNNSIKEMYIKQGFNQKGTVFSKLVDKYGEDNVKRVIMRSVNSEFKRYPHPIPIDIFRKDIVKRIEIE